MADSNEEEILKAKQETFKCPNCKHEFSEPIKNIVLTNHKGQMTTIHKRRESKFIFIAHCHEDKTNPQKIKDYDLEKLINFMKNHDWIDDKDEKKILSKRGKLE